MARLWQMTAPVPVQSRVANALEIVVVAGETLDWHVELEILLAAERYTVGRVEQLDSVLPMLASGTVKALFLAAGPLAASDLLLLQRIRQISPGTAVVVVTKTPTDPDLKRAFENGATAFLSWPAANGAVRHAIERSSHPGATGFRQ